MGERNLPRRVNAGIARNVQDNFKSGSRTKGESPAPNRSAQWRPRGDDRYFRRPRAQQGDSDDGHCPEPTLSSQPSDHALREYHCAPSTDEHTVLDQETEGLGKDQLLYIATSLSHLSGRVPVIYRDD